MKVQFLTNLGSRDAKDLGLDHSECADGAVVDVSGESGAILLKYGWAIEVKPEPKSKPAPKAPEPPKA